ncbi:molybdate ABC transporter substrate-binding protein [Demequina sp. SO4-18]|uniref:molybdate ABC transporter substrate-binding protein n=1 Tax=Demequina sp. SO4-18 TaxID=3401026 RepID=UPI003B5C87A2
MRRASAAFTAALAAVAACGLPGCAPAEASPRTVTVFAAASLTEVFAELEDRFEAMHPGTDLVRVHGGSAELAAAIREGAPADVFASANERQMETIAPDQAAPPRVFATNVLTMVVEPGNPLGLTRLADLERDGVVSVLCAEQVPCGEAAKRLAAASGVTLSPASEEKSVTDVLGKVATGQADAGLVYVTDVARSALVEEVAIAGSEAVRHSYPIAVTGAGSAPDLGTDFVDLVLAEVGREALESHGFGLP